MLGNKGSKQNGRSTDTAFTWLTAERGEEWETWRFFMAGWLATQHANHGTKIKTMVFFAMKYLPLLNDADPAALIKLAAQNTAPDLAALIGESMQSDIRFQFQNNIVEFIDWVIVNHYSKTDDNGRLLAVVDNPFSKAKKTHKPTETIHNPLPTPTFRSCARYFVHNRAATFLTGIGRSNKLARNALMGIREARSETGLKLTQASSTPTTLTVCGAPAILCE